jgi:pyridoxamine 5'-phosphate oxidase
VSEELRSRLRALRVFDENVPEFDHASAPDAPEPLFLEWLAQAIEAEVRAPHAMVLSTLDFYARPDSRVLLLKDVVDGRWAFATTGGSRKGKQLDLAPWAALCFHWPELGRQVRLRGRVADAGKEAAKTDFLERPEPSRVESWPGKQSQPLGDPAELVAAADQAAAHIADHPDEVPGHWSVYHLIPDEAEFWQGTPSRRHVRLRYRLTSGRWTKGLLWP